jgi:prepilin-type N-terminal cleavage/methylation domain-containing protein
MKNLQGQKGFTLVELAIVLTIIGLLIGGILKGQQLIANARVTAQIAQAQAVTAAITSFNDSFQGYPGDITSTAVRIQGCAGFCVDGDANSQIATGLSAWLAETPASNAIPAGAEPLAAWAELADANLISGVNASAAATATIGSAIPIAKIDPGTGLEVGTAKDGYIYIATVTKVGAPTVAPGANSMTAGQAAQIDRKMDDGIPGTGGVVGQGFTTCTGATYTEASATGKDCGLTIRVSQ